MERLTFLNGDDFWCVTNDNCFEEQSEHYCGPAIDRLAAYEDTGLAPEEIERLLTKFAEFAEVYEKVDFDHLRNLIQAEKESRLVVLPCKVGDTVYQLTSKRHAKGLGVAPRIVSSACVWSNGEYALAHQGMTYCQSKELGKTWFLTREEAEAALRGEVNG